MDTAATPLKEFDRGQLAELQDASGAPLGTVYVNPNTLLSARLLSRKRAVQPDTDWFIRRLRKALALREALYQEPYYRWVYGEADGLPGLVVDRYGPVLSVQVTTAGMEVMRPLIETALQAVRQPFEFPRRGIVAPQDAVHRHHGLRTTGNVPDEVTVRDNGIEFRVNLAAGQKTGWYFDQRDNRARLARYAAGRRVLDLYAYAGAWGLAALKQGASAALAVDSSVGALALADRAAVESGLALQTRQGQVAEVLAMLQADGERFGLCIVDPPALIKRKKDYDAGFQHYVKINQAAIELLEDDAWLVSCSCSHHLSRESLRKAVLQAARKAGRQLQIVETGAQSADHPVHPAMPETAYLDVLFCRVTGA